MYIRCDSSLRPPDPLRHSFQNPMLFSQGSWACGLPARSRFGSSRASTIPATSSGSPSSVCCKTNMYFCDPDVDGWGMESAQRKGACALDPDSDSSWRYSRCTGHTSAAWSATWSKATLRAAYFYQKPFYGWDEELDSLEGWLRIEAADENWMDIGKGLFSYRPAIRPTWSPDGRRLAFALNTGEGTREIFVAEGERLDRFRRLTFDAAWSSLPHWSPVGDQIAYFSRSHHSGVASLKFVRADENTGVKALSWGEIKSGKLE